MIPHDQRRFECINAKLLELEVVCTKQVDGMRFSPCQGYAKHGEIPTQFQAFDGVWHCQADQHIWIAFNPCYLPCNKGQSLMLELDTGRNGWDASNPQMLLFYDRKAIRGVDTNHRRFAFPQGVKEIVAYVYSGVDEIDLLPIKASFLVRDERVHALQNKIATLCEILSFAGAETKERSEISNALKRAVNVLDFTVPYSESFYSSIVQAENILQELVEGREKKATVWAIGHTHIDIAWLWTKAQTKEKALRSFGTVLSLMDEYPEYKFMSSQPILYEYVKEQDPTMYANICEKVAKGRWDAEGAMWVEPDCNLSSGEALVRQIMMGKQFFRDEFGVDNKVCWLPDVFGYSAALPQILKKSGVETFITSKISWNETDRMPHEIFDWQGIDGTSISTYFMTTQRKVKDASSFEFITYNGEGNSAEVEGTYFRLSDKELTNDVLMPTGHGDGGGGTTPKMIECINYLSEGIKGCSHAQFGTTGEFFKKLEENLQGKEKPRWIGELYLEFHRGTYTSIAKIKRNNRKAEFAMWRNEWLHTMAQEMCDLAYPKEKLCKNLKIILTNKFHDILPGSSIEEVYVKTDEDYRNIFHSFGELESTAQKAIAENVSKQGILVFNPNSYEGEGTVLWNGMTVGVHSIPSKGYAVVDSVADTNTIIVSDMGIENAFFSLEFDEEGNISSLLDKRIGRQVVKEGGVCNRIVPYENLPYEFDNWELKKYYQEKPLKGLKLVSITPTNDGVRRGLLFERKFLNSTIWQTVWLYEHIARIDFETRIDWHEHHVVLRAESETSVHADSATYEIQFGAVNRASNDNTSWDAAKFETCGHKYVDVSEYGYGVSLLNDCKYGHSVRGGKIGLTLLTCGTYPNANADQGEHIFTYSLMPHIGDYRTAEIIGQAYLLNNPLQAVQVTGKGKLPDRYSFIRGNISSVVIEVVKQSEDEQGVVVRAYESCGGRADCMFTTGFKIDSVWESNLLEKKEKELQHKEQMFVSAFAPYEIKTFYIKKRV